MIPEKWYYLLLMLGSILVPLLRSFEPRIHFHTSFGPLFKGIALVGGIFIIWDAIFTHYGIWGFNDRYLIGLKFLGLPLGEWLFFVVIPFCCIFIFRVMNYFISKDVGPLVTMWTTRFLLGFSSAMAIVHYDRWYTVLTFSLLALLLYLELNYWRSPSWLGNFYRSYLVVLIPFFIVNGILTGSWIEEQVVWYNPNQMIGVRIGTVPFEDAFYGMILILGITTIYEAGRRGFSVMALLRGEVDWDTDPKK
ncbi:MAG: lycopene cyclase domain-containing protein [Bacteroidota bacterium]|nr:lycopene cyclase domain-containing protein [Bacteroidota bacterium]MDX5504664.1 lycopene cyclase domain-containing protein [Bacteroidota bacterium]